MTDKTVTLHADGAGAFVARCPDGRAMTAACSPEKTNAFTASELLLAALANCIAASLAPLLARHGIALDALAITASARAPLPAPLDVSITLPLPDDGLLERCRRAAGNCPVVKSLAVPIEIHWRTD